MRVRITGRQLLAALLLLSAAGAAATSPLSPSLGASAWPLILPGWPALQLPAPGTPAAPRGASLRALLQAAAEEAIAAGDGGGGSMSGGSGSSSISGGGSGRASGLPVCELDLLHRVVDVDPPGGGFASVIVLQNNRELDLVRCCRWWGVGRAVFRPPSLPPPPLLLTILLLPPPNPAVALAGGVALHRLRFGPAGGHRRRHRPVFGHAQRRPRAAGRHLSE